MPAPYPRTGPVTLRTNLKDYPLTAALKAGRVSSPLVRFDFCGPPAVYEGFKPMLRERAFDAGELAIVTYLQARAWHKPLTLLPATVVGKFQHGTIYYRHRARQLTPKDMEGRKAIVRAYTQTTGVWARGILAHEHGVDLSRITWLTSDDPHLAEYRDPANVIRVDTAARSLEQRLIDGEADFGVIGIPAPKHPDVRPLLPDPEGAAMAWYRRHGAAHINHMFVVDSELARARPDVIEEIMRLLSESKAAAGLDGKAIDPLPFGVEGVRRSLDLVSQYAHEQGIIPLRLEVDELFNPDMRRLRP